MMNKILAVLCCVMCITHAILGSWLVCSLYFCLLLSINLMDKYEELVAAQRSYIKFLEEEAGLNG